MAMNYVEMDTDSAYIGIAGQSVEELVKPHEKNSTENGASGFLLKPVQKPSGRVCSAKSQR